MKKVRILGMVGVAPMVAGLGLAPPAANATAAAVTHSPRNGAKTVSLWHGEAPQAVPLINCAAGRHQEVTSVHGHLRGLIEYSHRCINRQYASLNKPQRGLTERTRFYSFNGTLEHTTWRGGGVHIIGGFTDFGSYPNLNAYEVCEALVANSNHNNVKYGPVCEKATS
jgi:hypothetical protein